MSVGGMLSLISQEAWSFQETSSSTKPAAVIDASRFANLQAALNALPESGGEVRLPPGTVEIREPLRLSRGDVKIVGAGTATHIVNKNEEGKPAWIVSPSEDDLKKSSKSRLWRIKMEDIRITGNPKSGHGIEAQNIDEIYLEGVTSSYHGGDGFHLKDCAEDPRVIGCLLTYNKKRGLFLEGCHDIVVSANQFEENEDALLCTDSFNLCMNGNNIDDHLRHGIMIENTYGSVVSGNMIEECNGTAILLDRDCYGVTLSSNVIAHHLQGGIDLRDAWGCAISSNTFVLVHEFSVRAGKESGRLTITGNSFCNSAIGGKVKRLPEAKLPMQSDAGSGIVLTGIHEVVISGNQFSGLGTVAVSATEGCDSIILQGNLATDCGKKLTQSRPWFDLPGLSKSEASGNLPKANERP